MRIHHHSSHPHHLHHQICHRADSRTIPRIPGLLNSRTSLRTRSHMITSPRIRFPKTTKFPRITNLSKKIEGGEGEEEPMGEEEEEEGRG